MADLHRAGLGTARALIRAGRVDETSPWSFSGSDGNRFLGPRGENWANLGKHHLGTRPGADKNTKAGWIFPFAKFKAGQVTLFRAALRAIRSRAGQTDDRAISEASRTLLDMLDAQRERRERQAATELQERPPTRVQSLLMSKERFRTRQAAARWAREHDFRTDKVDETDTGFRFRQLEPSACRQGSFRTIRLDRGVSAVICRPRAARRASEASDCGDCHLDWTKFDRVDVELEGGLADLCMLSVPAEILELRAIGNSTALSKSARLDLLKQSRQGEVVQLDIAVMSFQQPKRPTPLPASMKRLANRNFVTFRPQDLPKLAASFTGKPFLRDHMRRLDDVGGRIRTSELDERADRFRLHQGVTLLKPWAVEAALDGTLEMFSIAWEAAGGGGFRALRDSVFCTVCQKRLFSADCPHMPGEVVKVANQKQSVIVEAEFRDPRGVELSGVAFPAVKGTKVESIKPAS